MDVKIYTTPTCGYCQHAKKFISERGVKFIEYDISRDRAAADEMIRLTGHMGVPVIVVDGQIVVGFDRVRLEHLLAGSGNGQRPRFGLKIADASRIAQKHGGIPVFGALVGAVAPSSLGERAGIRDGDIITEINMRPVRNADDLESALAKLTTGNKATIILMRGQNTLKTEITL